jgi:hypothetical protein
MKLDEAYKVAGVITESSVSRTKFYLQNYECATISAFRPGANIGRKDEEELTNRKDVLKRNKQHSAELGKKLTKLGYTHFLVDGAWAKENKDKTPILNSRGEQVFGREITYFVVNNNGDTREQFRNNLKKLGSEFDQDSVMFYPKGSSMAFWSGTTKRESDLKFGQNRLLKNGRWEPQMYRTTLRGRKNTGYSYDSTDIKSK